MIIHYNATTGKITTVTTYSIRPEVVLSSDPSISIDSSDVSMLTNKKVDIDTKELVEA